MLGIWSAHTPVFLVLLAIGTLATLGLPMWVSPLGWARVLGWWIPEDTRLATYFGRCLASVICMLCWGALRAATHPAEAPLLFDLLTGSSALMIGIHLHGAVRRVQPRAETHETLASAALLFATVVFRPALG